MVIFLGYNNKMFGNGYNVFSTYLLYVHSPILALIPTLKYCRSEGEERCRERASCARTWILKAWVLELGKMEVSEELRSPPGAVGGT